MSRRNLSEHAAGRLRNSTNRTGADPLGLEWSVLAYTFGITLLITLVPFRFRWPPVLHYLWSGGWLDTICNVLLFLPLGFLYQLTRKGRERSSAFHVFCVGFGVSSCIEISQLFLPGRYSSPIDVVTNALGAWLGAVLCDRAQFLLNRQWIGRLGLELPLMNIVYLLVPLIWLDVLGAGNDSSRSRLAWILGICGSIVIAGVYRYGIKEPRVFNVTTLVAIAAGWFVAGGVPAVLNSPSTLFVGSVLVTVSVYLLVKLPFFGPSNQRRFELPILKRLWFPYAVYLLLLFLWPLPSHYGTWRGTWGLSGFVDDPPITVVLRLMEEVAAFTLFGYMVAESHGRDQISQTMAIVQAGIWCGVAGAVLEIGRGFHPTHTSSLTAGLLTFTGSLYGALIYRRQLASIQRLLPRDVRETPAQG